MRPDYLFNLPQLHAGQSEILDQLDSRFEPELGLPIPVMHVKRILRERGMRYRLPGCAARIKALSIRNAGSGG